MPTEDTPPAPQADLELEIAHLLLIDICGYSKLLANEQVESLRELTRIVRGTEAFRNAEANGKLVRVPTGDGMALLFFRSPEEPARCALEISQKVREKPSVQLRMGIHSGPVNHVRDVNDQINVAGAGINIAQRVMDCGDAGHILLSKHVAEDLAEYRHWQPYLRDLGEYEVKHGLRFGIVNLYKEGLGNPNLPVKLQRKKWRRQSATATVKPVRSRWSNLTTALVLSLAAIATALSVYFAYSRLSRSRIAAALAQKSIAVLPFENRSADAANAYFADSIQDEILTRLAKISDLKVISRTSTEQYKSMPQNLRDIAKQLDVANIVEGSVQKSGDAVRVTVQLINAANDTHIWADTFDRKLTDILSVESEVAKAIADQLQAKLTGAEERTIAAKPTDNIEAYDYYLRGLAYTLKTVPTMANTLDAQKSLKQAVQADPKFALAWAQLSIVYSRAYRTQGLQPTPTLREGARQAAEAALTLQPNLGEAVLAKGFYHYYCLRDYETALHYFERARQLLPNSSRIPESLAYVTRRRGQWERSDTYFNEAERLDPRNAYLITQHATNDICFRRFPEALRKFDRVLNIIPDDLDTLVQKAAVARAQGEVASAAALLSTLNPASDNSTAIETQVYQTILERRPAQMIDRLKQILTKPDAALGYFNGELRFWLGWAEDVAGDHAAAEETWHQARRELESFLKEQPENYFLIADLALINMSLGDQADAVALSERAMAANPIENDALVGPFFIEVSARIAARLGEPDRAIAALQKLLSTPYVGRLTGYVPITPELLRLDPMFDPIRDDRRFQKLIAPPAPK